jgi:hypothetical protein
MLHQVGQFRNQLIQQFIFSGPDIAGKTEFVTGKQFKRKSLVYQNKAIRKNPFLN